jgi:hypothetical protein
LEVVLGRSGGEVEGEESVGDWNVDVVGAGSKCAVKIVEDLAR